MSASQNSSVRFRSRAFALENISSSKIGGKKDAPSTPARCKHACSIQNFSPRFNEDRPHLGVWTCCKDATHEVPAMTINLGRGLREEKVEEGRHD